ncbi:hypothetical protein CP8484711_1062, partial [Chlamydia psittaci 84-8471/1]
MRVSDIITCNFMGETEDPSDFKS